MQINKITGRQKIPKTRFISNLLNFWKVFVKYIDQKLLQNSVIFRSNAVPGDIIRVFFFHNFNFMVLVGCALVDQLYDFDEFSRLKRPLVGHKRLIFDRHIGKRSIF